MMQITKGIEIIDLALYIEKYKALVISDMHIGFDESINKQGVLIPRFQFKDQVLRIEKILSQISPDMIILNGDIKHEFGRISQREWANTIKMLNFLSKKCNKLILIKGNHDKQLGPIADMKNIEICDNLVLDDILITHGNKKIKSFEGIKTIIIGHEHPAISLNEGAKTEIFKCFLKGKYEKRDLIVMPSFNLVTQGTDIIKEDLMSPFLQQNLDDFEIFIVEDKVYRFGKLKQI